MKKISEITEGLWDGIVKRGTTGEVRKEDVFPHKINIKEIGVVEMNGQFWADDLLTIHFQGEYGPRISHSYNSIKEIPQYVLRGWRLPTVEDFYKLHMDGDVRYSSCGDIQICEQEGKQGHHLTFEEDFVYMIEETDDGNNVVSVEFDEVIPAWANPNKNWCKLTPTTGDKQILVMLIRDNKI